MVMLRIWWCDRGNGKNILNASRLGTTAEVRIEGTEEMIEWMDHSCDHSETDLDPSQVCATDFQHQALTTKLDSRQHLASLILGVASGAAICLSKLPVACSKFLGDRKG